MAHMTIVGADGRLMNPDEAEAHVLVGAMHSMDDYAIGAAVANLRPGVLAALQRTPLASRIQQASQRLTLALPRPSVGESAPGPVGLSGVPFNSSGTVAAGATVTILVQPQSIFKPYKVVTDPVIAPFFLINSINVGTVPLFDSPGAIAATVFPPTAIQGNLKKITVNPGLAISMSITNRDANAHQFLAAIFGEAAPVQCG